MAFSEDTCLEKKRSAVAGDLKKSWGGIETEAGVELEEIGLEVSLVEMQREKGLTFARVERKTVVLIRPCPSRIRAPCVASTAVGTDGGGGPNGQVVSIERAADGRR